MDWAKAVEINQAALTRIVAGLIAMVGFAERLPGPVYRAVLRVLRPAESALRRLIVIAARGLVVKAAPARPWPQGRVVAQKGRGGTRVSFQLFDSRKRFSFAPKKPPFSKARPRIWSAGPDPDPLVPWFLRYSAAPEAAAVPVPEPDGNVDARRLGRRLAAVKLALDDLPRQAKRLKRWQARRETMKTPKFKSPLRPGPPPGHRKKPTDEIDFVLKECHTLARDALDTS